MDGYRRWRGLYLLTFQISSLSPRLTMASKASSHEESMLEVLSRALKDAQDHTSKLESELEAALKESDDLRKRNVRLTADLAEMLDTKSVKIENATASEFPAASEKVRVDLTITLKSVVILLSRLTYS
ncbi:hypothetical protein FB446DRAFT_463488 [Lentinula raphanica]|nr:hypothetical protein FB446DRAFT_463488 [Lentinula raphanica]